MSSGLGKRKRGGAISTPLGHLYVDTSPRKKRVRKYEDDDHDDASSFAASENQSYVESDDLATATIAHTQTPLTESSSVRSKSKPREKRYQCPFDGCTKAYDRPVRLQNHINSHTGERPHQCPEDNCDKSFYKPEHLNRHIKDKHGSSTFLCEYKVFNDQTQAREPCGKLFPSRSKLKRHMAVHEDKEETTCSWDGCGKVFRKQETLQRHIKKDHLGEDSYMCKREWPGGDMCGQAFSTLRQLRGHEARAHEAPKYWCEICTEAGLTAPAESKPLEAGLDDAFLPAEEDLLFPRAEIDHQMLDSLTLNESAPVQPPSIGVVSFPTYRDLQRHNTLVHPPTCTECGKICRSKKHLTAHMDIEHSGDPDAAAAHKPPKKYVCPYDDCIRSAPGLGFSKKGNVDQHIKSVHTKEKKFVCGESDLSGCKKIEGWNGEGCGLSLVTKQALVGHIRTQHLGLKATTAKGANAKKTTERKSKKGKSKQTPEDEHENDITMSDIPSAAPEFDKSLSLITGYGYEQRRPYACLLASSRGCQMRFVKEHELGVHMELTHGWNIEDINEALDDPDIFAEDTDVGDRILRRRLEAEMRIMADNQISEGAFAKAQSIYESMQA